LQRKQIYGRLLPLATIGEDGTLAPVKWLRKKLGVKLLARDTFDQSVLPRLSEWTEGAEVEDLVTRGQTISARLDFSARQISAHLDSHGRALHAPPEREALPLVCRDCPEREHDQTAPISMTPAYAWRALGLIEADGTPTRRGVLFGFFQSGEGLAIAAALEDESYPIDDLVFDLANLRAGPRFAGEDSPMGGRLGILCQRVYDRADHPGYLEMGVPIQYGAGAAEVMREVIANPNARPKFTSEGLRAGDIERALMEWRSILRHIAAAPDLDWARWRELKAATVALLGRTNSPTALPFPPLLASQQRRSTEYFA